MNVTTWWNKSVTDENGVEVTYSSNCDVYWANLLTGEYTAKIDVYPTHIESYNASDSTWEKHDHWHTDDSGTKQVHPMEERDWTDNFRG